MTNKCVLDVPENLSALAILRRILPFITPALAREAMKLDGQPPSNARVLLRGSAKDTLRLQVEPMPIIGDTWIHHFQTFQSLTPSAEVRKLPDKSLRRRIPSVNRVDEVRVYRGAGPKTSGRNIPAFDARLIQASLDAEQRDFSSACLPNSFDMETAKQNTMDATRTCIQQIGYVLLKKLSKCTDEERQLISVTTQLHLRTNQPALVTYIDASHRRRGFAYVGSVGPNDLSGLYSTFRELECVDGELW